MKNKVIIDHSKCTLCENCISVCGTRKLELKDNSIQIVENASCILCGHCAAICPVDAISLPDDCQMPYETKYFDENLTEIEKLLKNKRSVREFTPKKIEKEILGKFVYYAEKAPSSSNKRKREYIVITDENKILELEKTVIEKFNSYKTLTSDFSRGLIGVFSKHTSKMLNSVRDTIVKMNTNFDKKDYPVFRGAPAVVFIIAPTKDMQAKDDCVISQQYMMLYAQSLGIGSTIIGYAQHAHKSLEKALNIKEGYSVFSASIFGYQKFKYKKEINFINIPKITWY
ncbi:MAG: nitroreductase family protein [Bacteroidales bacterium]|nr:nitroreductase family protein [Bacteroidales bacterium]